MGVRDACGAVAHRIAPAAKTLDIKQSDYRGGIQVWGSNPAFLWKSPKDEEEGIHVHAFMQDENDPILDDTYREVIIDGIKLDPKQVRVLMAQNVMPSLKDRVQSVDCSHCGHPGFDSGEAAYVPAPDHTCSECGRQFRAPGRIWKSVINPLPAILGEIAKVAPRRPQQHRLDLLPETL